MSIGTSNSNTGSDSVSSSLLRGVKQHDPQAWRRLSGIFCPVVFGWARGAGLQSCDASDIAQEVFRAVAQNIDAFRKDQPGDSFRGWLWTITQNKIRDHFRQAANRPQVLGGTDARDQLAQIPAIESEATVSLSADLGAQGQVVGRALDMIQGDFEPTTWQAFWRAVIDGQATGDIASDLGLSKQGVRQAKYRVLRRLRQELEGLME